MRILSSVVFVLLLSHLAYGLYSAKSPVVQLTKKNFADLVIGSEHVWVVEFFAPWCGHCKSFAPEYEKAAGNLKGIVKVGAVDCDQNDNKELCGSFGVQGFPTVKVFPSKATPGKKEGTFNKVPEDYQGARSAAAVANFALSKLPSFVSAVTSKNHDKFLENALPKAILFSNKDKTSDLYKALSIDLHNRMILGEAKHSDKKLVEQYGITAFPTLLVLQKEGEAIKFEGKLSHETLTKFLEPHAIPAPKQEKKAGGSSSKAKAKEQEPEVEPETGDIFEIRDQAAFDQHVANKGGLTAIAVFDYANFEQSELDNYVATLKALGEKFKGKLRIVYMDGPSQADFTKTLDLSANYPNAVVLSAKKLRYTPFMGAFTKESLGEFFEAVLRGGKRSPAIDRLPTIATFTPPPPRVPVPVEEDDIDIDDIVEPKEKDEL